MGANLGLIQGGAAWSDAFLWDHTEGDSLAIALAEEATSDAVWECRVLARTDHGSYHIGTFRTRPPSLGEIPARLVAIAFFPGATAFLTSWRLVSGGDPLLGGADVAASVRLSSAPYAGTTPGVTPVLSRSSGAAANRNFSFVGPTANAQLLPRTATVFQVDATLVNANVAAANAWVALFDQAAAPIAGDVPFWSAHLGQSAALASPDGSRAVYDAGPNGRPIVNGLWLASSDAAGVLVVSAQTLTAAINAVLP